MPYEESDEAKERNKLAAELGAVLNKSDLEIDDKLLVMTIALQSYHDVVVKMFNDAKDYEKIKGMKNDPIGLKVKMKSFCDFYDSCLNSMKDRNLIFRKTIPNKMKK